MQLVFWDEDEFPEKVIPLSNGDTQLFDYPYWNGFEVKDRIVVLTPMGPEMYKVVDVEPEYEEDDLREMRRVTIRSVY